VEIDKLLQEANKLSAATKQRLQAGRLKSDDFPNTVAYLQDTMEITNGRSRPRSHGIPASGPSPRPHGTRQGWRFGVAVEKTLLQGEPAE
jgi:hypothetical protein